MASEMRNGYVSQAKLVAAVQVYALDNWDHGGWDIVHETMDYDDIARAIEGCATEEEAIAEVRDLASLWQDDERMVRVDW